MTGNLTVTHHMALVRVEIIQDKPGVSNDQSGFYPVHPAAILLQQSANDLPHHLQIF